MTIQQRTEPCFVIDIGKENTVHLYNLRMLLQGPNRDAEPQSFMADMNFESSGNEKCMREFFTHIFKAPTAEQMDIMSRNQYCIILLKSGNLKLHNCTLSLE